MRSACSWLEDEELFVDGSSSAEAQASAGSSARQLGYVLNCMGVQRRQRFAQARRLAIRLATDAAKRLSAPTIDKRAADLFIYFFGTRPDHRPAWADRTAARLVAHRFEVVARELAGGRRIRYTCEACPGFLAITTGKSAITLCDAFWGPGRSIADMAGTLLHEGMHAVYWELFHHAVASGIAECRRDNARCYQGFALRLAGYGVGEAVRTRCRRSPEQCRRLP